MKRVLLLACLLATSAFAQFTPFPPGPTITMAQCGGLPNDGIEDTAALQCAMGAGGFTVSFSAGTYDIHRVNVPSNTVLQLNGAVLRNTGRLAFDESVINLLGVTNVRIVGGQVVANGIYTTGEFRHGIIMRGPINVEINNVVSSGHGGDGFYLGTGTRGVTIVSSAGSQNRRNGLSIVAGVDVLVQSSAFSNNNGTAPRCGVDVEPNNNGDVIQRVTLVNVATLGNAGCGISVFLVQYTAAAPPAIVSMIGHRSFVESRPYFQQGVRPGIDQISRR